MCRKLEPSKDWTHAFQFSRPLIRRFGSKWMFDLEGGINNAQKKSLWEPALWKLWVYKKIKIKIIWYPTSVVIEIILLQIASPPLLWPLWFETPSPDTSPKGFRPVIMHESWDLTFLMRTAGSIECERTNHCICRVICSWRMLNTPFMNLAGVSGAPMGNTPSIPKCKQGWVCHTVASPFRLKSILRQKKEL